MTRKSGMQHGTVSGSSSLLARAKRKNGQRDLRVVFKPDTSREDARGRVSPPDHSGPSRASVRGDHAGAGQWKRTGPRERTGRKRGVILPPPEVSSGPGSAGGPGLPPIKLSAR